jgi:hypothetical protein
MEEKLEVFLDNQIVQDWLYEFSIYPGLKLVEMSLYIVAQETRYINETAAHEALVACEVLARLNGKNEYKTKEFCAVDKWVSKTPIVVSEKLKNKAICAIDKILSSQSELMILHRDNPPWVSAVSKLKKRIKS